MPERKIPTIIGIMLVLGAVFLFSLAFDRITPLLSRASPSVAPKHVTFSNISDTSFTVTWVTETPATGTVIIDGSGIGTLYDQRDENAATHTTKKALGSYAVHSVLVRNARAQTSYHIRILSAGSLFQDGSRPYTVTTGAPIPGTGINLEPAYGTVTIPSGQPAEGTIVYLTPEGGQTLSAFVMSSGSWVIPLHLTRTADLTSYLPLSDRINESIVARAIQGEATAITDTLNDNPVPAMTIGKDYDFRKIQANNESSGLAQAPSAVLGESTQVSNPTVAITQPAEGAHLTSNLPLFQGTGVPGKQVFIIVGITNPVSSTVTVGADGLWRMTPDRPLAEGKQSITITTQNTNDATVAMTHTFEVLKSGTQVLGDATPSATLEPTITDTPAASDTATLSGEPLPTSGNETPTLILLLLGVTMFIGGTAVLFL